MDPLTQAVLGGGLAQAVCHRRLGRTALICGAVGGVFPDVDVFFSANQWEAWANHRGITHSLFFPPVASPALGLALWGIATVWRRLRSDDAPPPLAGYIWATFLGMMTHALLDFMTPYGTQLLAPFSNHRFAVNGISIIDPIYTLPLLAALIYGWSRRRDPVRVRGAAVGALLFAQAYLGLNCMINLHVERVARDQLAAEGVPPGTEVMAYPTIFQGLLRRVVVWQPDAIRVGFYTVLNGQTIRWRSFPRADNPLQHTFLRSDVGQLFHWFSMGRLSFIVRRDGDATALEVWDIRYGLPDFPRKGMWGVEALYDDAGRPLAEPRPIRIDRTSNLGQNLIRLWWGVIGDARGGFH